MPSRASCDLRTDSCSRCWRKRRIVWQKLTVVNVDFVADVRQVPLEQAKAKQEQMRLQEVEKQVSQVKEGSSVLLDLTHCAVDGGEQRSVQQTSVV